MKKLLPALLSLFLLVSAFHALAQKTPKRELRGAWVTTHINLDWPFLSSHTPQRQRDSLIAILDQHKATGMNTIYFQVRNQSDALYPSTLEPWSHVLTGTYGRDPGWDPLQFAIDECRKRGMELHAWINPYRAASNTNVISSFAPNHLARAQPGWLLTQGTEAILNPGLQQVRDHVLRVIADIVTRYDVDGVHFDDYFYHAPSTTVPPYNDDATYAADPRGFANTTAGRADWRRDNVNMLIKRVYDTVRLLKPWVKFGVSPSGIYRSSTNPAIGSNTSAGAFQHYSAIYADSRRWLQEGWVDYIAPQVYWFIGQTGSDYANLIPWWNNQAFGRHIYIGQAIYKVADPNQGANWANRSQIPNQMRMNRLAMYPNIYGEIGFRTRHLRTNLLNVRDSIRTRIYVRPALPPTMPWVDAIAPAAPTNLVAAKQADGSYVLNWTNPAPAANEMDKVRQVVIYRSETPSISISDTANLLHITPTAVNTFTDNTTNPDKTYYYVVTTVDRMANESAPSNVTDYLPPVITCPADQKLTLNASCSGALPDYRSMANVSDDVSTGNQLSVTQSPAAGTSVQGTGNLVVTLTATDASGKSSTCTFTVTKEDKTAPVLTAAVAQGSKTVVSTSAGNCGYTATTTFDVAASDACSGQLTYRYTLTSNGAAGSPVQASSLQGVVLPKGLTTVTWTVTDVSGNSANYSYSIEVMDTEAPVLVCPANLVVNPTSLNGAMVNYAVPVGTDNCPGTITTRVAGPASGSIFPIGTTTITYGAVDAAGNSVQCSFTVTVRNPYCDNNRNNRKVYVCHNGQTICISVNALPALLKQGAQLGQCEWYVDPAITMQKQSSTLTGETSLRTNFQVTPNPVSSQMQIRYELETGSQVKFEIVDAAGRILKTLSPGIQPAGRYVLPVQASTLAKGVYFCRMTTICGDRTSIQVQRLVKAH
jgi:uncharacterized lipoprotein YddW (UPF0748 family)